MVCSVLLVLMLMVTFVQVVMRFVFNSPFSWSEEVTLMLLVWFGYICMSVDIYTDKHAALYFLYNRLPAPFKKGADLLRFLLLFWFFTQMVWYGGMITRLNLPKAQPATGASQGLLFMPLVAGGILMAVFCIINFASVCMKPLSVYRRKEDREKTVDELNVERGGTL